MSYIWNEKPTQWQLFGNAYYDITEMDAWLEKLRECWDNTMELNRKLLHDIGRLEEELSNLNQKVNEAI